ncbi:DUF6752 domain-containing protein [Nocardioides montaniterrae]
MNANFEDRGSSIRERAAALRARRRGFGGEAALERRIAVLEAAVEENRELNQRLVDLIDVVTEVLVPTVDRDDERLRAALANLGKKLDQS